MSRKLPDDLSADLDADFSSTTATVSVAETPAVIAPEWTGARCEKCSAPLKSEVVTVCRKCGWYPSLGRFLEVDQDWEVDFDACPGSVAGPRASHVSVWLKMLPRWAWIMIATVAAVVAESVLVRLATPDGSSIRTIWSLSQLFLGFMALAGCHVFNFLTAASDDSDVGALDIILKPLKLWFRAFRHLPLRLWVTDVAAAGLTGVVMSLVVIGSLPYERLWDWGFKKPANQNLMGAVASRLQQLDSDDQGADNLEDAVHDFAGKENLEAGDAKPTPPPKPREKTDCVILGYRLDAKDKLTALVLGTAYHNKLIYAGSVTPHLPEDEEAKLVGALVAAKTNRPFLSIQASAIWVEPKYSCRVNYAKRLESGGLQDPQWEELLGAFRLK